MSISFSDDSLKSDISPEGGKASLIKSDLLLFNNMENGYKDMLDAIIEICDYDPIQAEQCAYLAYHKGYCQIKKDEPQRIKKLLKEFERKGLWVKII